MIRGGLTVAVALALTMIGAAAARAGFRAPGKYSGVVVFDRWDGCYLYSGVYLMYVAEAQKASLRPYRGQSIQIDAREVYQPINPGDGRIGALTVLGPAPPARNWASLDGLRLAAAAAPPGDGGAPRVTIAIHNDGKRSARVFSEEIGLTLLARAPAGPPGARGPGDGPSYAMLTREALWTGSEPRWQDTLWTIGAAQALPHDQTLAPGAALRLTVTFRLPPGEYEFLFGYGGGVHEGRGLASNLVALDVGKKDPPMDYPKICRAIARDIEALKPEFPQLAAFSADRALGPDCAIDYAYRTHQPPRIGGWRGGFLEPDADGIALFIHLWDERDPSSARQADTQPDLAERYIGVRRVTRLILEGARVPPVAARIERILVAHGMTATRGASER